MPSWNVDCPFGSPHFGILRLAFSNSLCLFDTYCSDFAPHLRRGSCMTLAPEPFKSTADWSGDSDPEATLPAKIHAQVRSSETTRRLSGIYRAAAGCGRVLSLRFGKAQAQGGSAQARAPSPACTLRSVPEWRGVRIACVPLNAGSDFASDFSAPSISTRIVQHVQRSDLFSCYGSRAH